MCSQRYRIDRGYSYKHILKNKAFLPSCSLPELFFFNKTVHANKDLAELRCLETELNEEKRFNCLEQSKPN